MKQYAIVPINRANRNNEIQIRAVLISYESTVFDINTWGLMYQNTKILAKDAYFENDQASHKYQFENDGYTLVQEVYGINYPFENQKRPYHVSATGIGDETFEAETDEEAIKIFRESAEKREHISEFM